MRLSTGVGLSGAILCAALLTACGGGGGGAAPGGSGTSPSGPSGYTPGTSTTLPKGTGTRITLTIVRGHKNRTNGHKRVAASGKRKPLYISYGAEGLQVAVSTTGTGATTQTIYADISSNSALCTQANITTGSGNTYTYTSTCTISVPTLGANEQIQATEVDALPTGDTAGYGTGFPTTANILAVGSATPTITLGAVSSVSFGLNPVAGGEFYDCTTFNSLPNGPPLSTSNFGFGRKSGGSPVRIVVTEGVASGGVLEPEFEDAAEDCFDGDTTPLPFVDVNGSPTPITITAASSAITLAPMENNGIGNDSGTPPPAGAYGAVGTIPDDSYQWDGCFFAVGVNVGAGLTGTNTTITINNNLTATSTEFSAPPYPQTMTWIVAALSSTQPGNSVSNGGPNATVTGTDYDYITGMDAESAAGAEDEECKSSGGTELATVVPSAPSGAPNWTTTFTIASVGAGAGTCTFVEYDEESGVVTTPITVTVNS